MVSAESHKIVCLVSRQLCSKKLGRDVLYVPLLFPHLFERVGQIKCANLLRILKFQKLISTVACHVDQNVAPIIGQQPLAPGCLFVNAIRQEANKVLNGNLVAPIVDLDVVAVQVDGAVGIGIDGTREGVAWVAGHVVGQHQDDLAVGDAQTLDGTVDGQHIGEVTVVEPEARGADQDGPIAGVLGEGMAKQQGRKEDGELEEGRELHHEDGCWRLAPDGVY